MNTEIILLFKKYVNNLCSSEELERVISFLNDGKYQDELNFVIREESEKILNSDLHADMSLYEVEALHDRIKHTVKDRQNILVSPARRTYWPRIAAAIVVFVFGTAIYLNQFRNKETAPPKNQYANDIKPGGNKAILTLGDGKRILLTDTKTGEIAEQSGIKITKTADGRLIYTLAKIQPSTINGASLYNTITTPKGGQYQVVLPDGSRIWLNAASSLRYPTIFDSYSRKVELSGEGYFEVAKAKNKQGGRIPFIVKTNNQQVEVLGTQFNINAYEDEKATITTLLEGSVRVSAAGGSVLIVPGEHAVLNGTSLSTGVADMEGALAWKNGFFFFKNADIKTVMRQLSRWYNLDVDYEGAVPLKKFSGEIYRNASINQVFELLSYFKVNYRIETIGDGKNKLVIIP